MLAPFLRRAKYGLVGAVLLLSACHSTGTNFNSAGFGYLQPGLTTFTDAIELLEADPVNRYYRADGSYTARWAHVASLVPDGIYMPRELWLDFDARNYLIRVSKRQNVHTPVETAPPAEH